MRSGLENYKRPKEPSKAVPESADLKFNSGKSNLGIVRDPPAPRSRIIGFLKVQN